MYLVFDISTALCNIVQVSPKPYMYIYIMKNYRVVKIGDELLRIGSDLLNCVWSLILKVVR